MRVVLVLVLSLFTTAVSAQHQNGNSAYAGQQTRAVKSLSGDDLKQIKAGKGWGLAKMAELNGYPGPSHVLELAEELDLNEEQIQKTQQLFSTMEHDAIIKGEAFIAAEKEIEQAFQTGEVDEVKLKKLVLKSAEKRGELRLVHLKAHLAMMQILNEGQIQAYNKLRGYSKISDPCENIPEGHNAEMWKKHNGCNR